jgi:hypothetical protein
MLGRLGNPPSASYDAALAVRERQQPLQLRHIETDQIELEVVVAQPSQLLPNQDTRNNPLAIPVGNCVVRTLGLAEPSAPHQRTDCPGTRS